jgi:methylmalonic aciduria homocystinuria type C protein
MDLSRALRDAGFAITASLPWREAIAIAPALATDVTAKDACLLVGNTRDLWPRFVAAYQADAGLRASRDPFDQFVETELQRCAGDRAVKFAHRSYAQGYLPMQRLAVAAGLGVLAGTQLVIHPVCGPWLSLRAVILLQPTDAVVSQIAAAPSCEPPTCNHRCEPLFQLAKQRGADAHWRDWLAPRAACAVGSNWRFSDEQIIYHYTKDQRVIGTGATLASYALLENSSTFTC